jgi:hypothetical protein
MLGGNKELLGVRPCLRLLRREMDLPASVEGMGGLRVRVCAQGGELIR